MKVSGARLRRAGLACADLRQADLSGGFLAQANLRGAKLEGASLAGADLSHADCAGALMGEADLRGALLEEASLEGASLRFVDGREAVLEGAILAGADLWGARLERADLSGALMRGARLGDASLTGADLAGADLREAVLASADLGAANLADADLRGASLKGATLAGANLAGAQLQDVDLSGCDLTGARWSHARLGRTRFEREQLGGVVGEEAAGEFTLAATAYLTLERNFADLGDPEAASWAYRRKRRMQKRAAGRLAMDALRTRQPRTFALRGLTFLGNSLVELVCDYGESIGRVFGALAVVFVTFTVIYGLTDSVTRTDGKITTITHNPVDLAIFSLMAMTTSGTPSVTLSPAGEYALLISGSQALIGIFLTGLLGFVAGNRIRR